MNNLNTYIIISTMVLLSSCKKESKAKIETKKIEVVEDKKYSKDKIENLVENTLMDNVSKHNFSEAAFSELNNEDLKKMLNEIDKSKEDNTLKLSIDEDY